MTRNGCSVFDRSVFSYIPAIGKVGIFVSHHDVGSFPPNAPHMRHGKRGERSRRLLAFPLSSLRCWALLVASDIGTIRRDGSDLRIFYVGLISRLSCSIAVLFYRCAE